MCCISASSAIHTGILFVALLCLDCLCCCFAWPILPYSRNSLWLAHLFFFLWLIIVEFFYFPDIVSKKGSDAWWYMTTEDLLPEKYRQNASEYYKGTDTMDVWFDSGMKFWYTNCGILKEYFILHGPNLLAPFKD